MSQRDMVAAKFVYGDVIKLNRVQLCHTFVGAASKLG
jgi:hypothetical protein